MLSGTIASGCRPFQSFDRLISTVPASSSIAATVPVDVFPSVISGSWTSLPTSILCSWGGNLYRKSSVEMPLALTHDPLHERQLADRLRLVDEVVLDQAHQLVEAPPGGLVLAPVPVEQIGQQHVGVVAGGLQSVLLECVDRGLSGGELLARSPRSWPAGAAAQQPNCFSASARRLSSQSRSFSVETQSSRL